MLYEMFGRYISMGAQFQPLSREDVTHQNLVEKITGSTADRKQGRIARNLHFFLGLLRFSLLAFVFSGRPHCFYQPLGGSQDGRSQSCGTQFSLNLCLRRHFS
jgi:hypothetical protein